MTERQFLRRNPKALRLDYGSFEANADDVGLFCLSRSSWMLARNLVEFYGGWRSRYVEDVTASQLRGVTDAEWSDLQQWFERAQAELEGDMSCDFTAVLEQINLTLQGIGVNINVAGGACCSPVEGLPPVAEPQLGNPAIDDPPDGFDTWAEYEAYKCRAANRIADDWIATLDNMGTLGGALGVISGVALAAFINTSLLSGVLVGLMAIGFSAFSAAAIIIAALVTLALSGVGLFAYFASVSGELDTIKEDLVCDLYNAQTVEAAYNAVVASTENAVDSVVFSGNDGDIFTPVLSDITDNLFNAALLNILFTSDEATGEYVGTVDCDNCTSALLPCDWMIAPSALLDATAGVSFTVDGGGVAGSGAIDNLFETSFTVDSVLATVDGSPAYVVALCTRDLYDYWLANGTLPAIDTDPGFACDADDVSSQALESISFSGDSNLSVYSRRYVGGNYEDGFNPIFLNNPAYGLQLWRHHHGTALGSFQHTLRVNQPT